MKNLFSKIFKNQKDSPNDKDLNEQYNVMKNIILETAQKYADESQFRLVKDNIYEDLNDGDETKYRMTISYRMMTSIRWKIFWINFIFMYQIFLN